MAKVLTDSDIEVVELSREAKKVIQWRYDWLRSVEYSLEDAGMIAENTAIDLHFAVELAKRCKDADVRMRILF